jgi:hypothetical protein
LIVAVDEKVWLTGCAVWPVGERTSAAASPRNRTN